MHGTPAHPKHLLGAILQIVRLQGAQGAFSDLMRKEDANALGWILSFSLMLRVLLTGRNQGLGHNQATLLVILLLDVTLLFAG